MDEMMVGIDADVKLAVETLKAKKRVYDKLWAYYDGDQPLVYSTERLKDAFNGLNARFSLNWCAVIVDSVMERLELKQFALLGEGTAEALNAWWVESEMDLDSDDVELCALVTGEAFVLSWPNDEGGFESYYNDSRMVAVFYEPDRPREMRMGAKWWVSDELIRLTLYYPDRLGYWAAEKPKNGGEISAKSFKRFVPEGHEAVEGLAEHEAVNPMERVPIFHFRRERRAIKSELGPSILNTQDGVNKLLADMMIASEYGAFKQRYVISGTEVDVLKNAPNEVWDLPAGDGVIQDTTVGQFSETNLQNFMGPLDKLSTSMAKMSRTPQYYFFLGARSDPSGETLYAMDGPLVKKCESYIKRFKREWLRFGRMVAAQLGLEIDPMQLVVEYADPRQSQPYTQAQTRVQNKTAGIPLKTQLKREGWSEGEIVMLEADVAAEREAAEQSLANGMLRAQRGFDAS